MDEGVESLCDVILIAGFLGAGKTTLLRNILKWPGDLSRTALLVNEFGQIGIDGALLNGFDTPVYELTNGCICCTLQGDFIKAAKAVLETFHPVRLFIEATGVADPSDIMEALNSVQLKGCFETFRVITVIDADIWEGKEYFGPLFYNQIKAAHLLLFNKIDLLPEQDVSLALQEIKEINPSASIVPTHHCQIEPEVLFKPTVKMDDEITAPVPHLQDHHESAVEMGYVAFAFEEKSPFKTDCFERFIENMPMELYRMKGFALLGNRRFFLNHVGGKTERVELDEPGPTKLAFVGWQVNEKELLNELKACLAPV